MAKLVKASDSDSETASSNLASPAISFFFAGITDARVFFSLLPESGGGSECSVIQWRGIGGIRMRAFDIKSDHPTVAMAEVRLRGILQGCRGKEKAVKIIHGYGSTGAGGAIREAVRRILAERKDSGSIRAYIPGEATALLMGFDEDILRYRGLLAEDPDFRRGNDGITYVVF